MADDGRLLEYRSCVRFGTVIKVLRFKVRCLLGPLVLTATCVVSDHNPRKNDRKLKNRLVPCDHASRRRRISISVSAVRV